MLALLRVREKEFIINTNRDAKRIFFENIPLLHTFDGGISWNTGGFKLLELNYFYDLADSIPD